MHILSFTSDPTYLQYLGQYWPVFRVRDLVLFGTYNLCLINPAVGPQHPGCSGLGRPEIRFLRTGVVESCADRLQETFC